MCKPWEGASNNMNAKSYANSLRRLADEFRNVCPNATFFLRQEAQNFDYEPAFGPLPIPNQKEPREWFAYVDVNGRFYSQPPRLNAYTVIKVREVL